MLPGLGSACPTEYIDVKNGIFLWRVCEDSAALIVVADFNRDGYIGRLYRFCHDRLFCCSLLTLLIILRTIHPLFCTWLTDKNLKMKYRRQRPLKRNPTPTLVYVGFHASSYESCSTWGDTPVVHGGNPQDHTGSPRPHFCATQPTASSFVNQSVLIFVLSAFI